MHLGTGESGKSTIVKQMKIIHLNGFTKEECLEYRNFVFSNSIDSLKTILKAMNNLSILFGDNKSESEAKKFLNYIETSFSLNEEVGSIMKNLWQDNSVQECFSRSREYQLNDSAK